MLPFPNATTQGHPNRITKVEEGEVAELSEAERGRMAVERGAFTFVDKWCGGCVWSAWLTPPLGIDLALVDRPYN